VKAPSGSTTFPPYTGLVPIIAAWFISPILTGACAALLFTIIRHLVLKRKNSYRMSFYLLPFFVTLTVWLCLYYTLYKVRRCATCHVISLGSPYPTPLSLIPHRVYLRLDGSESPHLQCVN
jgi:phosphate/sulfate permease